MVDQVGEPQKKPGIFHRRYRALNELQIEIETSDRFESYNGRTTEIGRR